ncbi:MAG: 2-phospho-L-lactate transferase [Nitrospinae bacterium]|nr:2-phospho-L-lactate transferase [Nitrospinota bacterium]
MSKYGKVVAFAGGVGGAKLATGLNLYLEEGSLSVVVNTADDFTLHGLHISPDVDTVMYNIAGLSDPNQGWGIKDDTNEALKILDIYGGPSWFKLGDKDIATHIRRTQRLNEGKNLTEVTSELCTALGIKTKILPMTNNEVATRIITPEGELEFQDYFVARKTLPKVIGVNFHGIEKATGTKEVLSAIEEASHIIFCPSNPIVSIGPILEVKEIRKKLLETNSTSIAVSPIIGGKALRGPAAEMLKSLNCEVSAVGVAKFLRKFIDGFVIDSVDEQLKNQIEKIGLKVKTLPTIMSDLQTKKNLAKQTLEFSESLK